MEAEHIKKNSKQQIAEEPESDSAADTQSKTERGAEVLEKAEKAVSDAYDKTSQAVSDAYDKTSQAVSDTYDKTSQAVSDTYDQAKIYSSRNPGKAMLLALGVGVGAGFILGASYRRSRISRFAEPVVNALSDIARAFIR